MLGSDISQLQDLREKKYFKSNKMRWLWLSKFKIRSILISCLLNPSASVKKGRKK